MDQPSDRPTLPVDLKELLGQQAEPNEPEKVALSRSQKTLIGVVVAGALLIAGLGFWGSYAAVSALAATKHFGAFSRWFPIGIDAGIAVLLSLDMVLAGLRIPFPLLRQFAWVLTVATICFNAATARGDWLAVAMHAIIPMLFIVIIEGGRHAIRKIADITAEQLIESPPLTRWILAPWPTFRIWRRMRMWRIASYERAVSLERDTYVLRTRLRLRHGRKWRTASSERAQLALYLSRYGISVWDTLTRALPDIDPDSTPADSPQTAPGKPGQQTPDNTGTSSPTRQDSPDSPAPGKSQDTRRDSNVVSMSTPRQSHRTKPPKTRTVPAGQPDVTLTGHVLSCIAAGITDTDTVFKSARDKFGPDTKRETVRRLVNRHSPDDGEETEDPEAPTGTDN